MQLRRQARNLVLLARDAGPRAAGRALRLAARRVHLQLTAQTRRSRSREPILVHGHLRMATDPQDRGIGEELRRFGVHEPILTSLLPELVSPGSVVLDVGANIGYYTLLLRRLAGAEGRVVAIEPSGRNLRLLRRNLALNGFDDVETHRLALARESGRATLHVSGRSNWSTLLPRPGERYQAEERVQAMSLDALTDHLGLDRLDLLRMDIEGLEFEVLAGMRSSLDRLGPVIAVETHADAAGDRRSVRSFWEELFSLGYAVRHIYPRSFDSIVPFHVSEIARFGSRAGDRERALDLTFAAVEQSGRLWASQFIAVLVPR